MRVLIGTHFAVGHQKFMLPIAQKLVTRGHEVWWYTGRAYQAQIESVGATYVPMQHSPDHSQVAHDQAFEGRDKLGFFAGVNWDMKHIFIKNGLPQLKDLSETLQRFPADVILTDTGFYGAQFLYERGGPPWATISVGPLTISSRDTAPFGPGIRPDASPLGRLRNRLLNLLFRRVIYRDEVRYANSVRASLGLPPQRGAWMDAFISPLLHIGGQSRAFEYPRSDLPPHVHLVGPFLQNIASPFTPPAWWDDLKGEQPVVLLTQGTVTNDPTDMLAPVIKVLADDPVLVVATIGGKPLESLRIDRPANLRLETFIPHEHLMPYVDVLVTNGGYHAVQRALSQGIPVVASGRSEDKLEVGARIEWAGAGLSLRKKQPDPHQIRAAVQRVLREPHFKRNAERLCAEFKRYDAPSDSVALIEQLGATGQPVLRKP